MTIRITYGVGNCLSGNRGTGATGQLRVKQPTLAGKTGEVGLIDESELA